MKEKNERKKTERKKKRLIGSIMMICRMQAIRFGEFISREKQMI